MKKLKGLFNYRAVAILAAIVAVIALAGVAFAATFILNQDVGVSIKVNPSGGIGGGGGGDIPDPEPTTAYIYTDSDFSQILTSLNFEYIQGGSAEYTGYVKAEEISAIDSPYTFNLSGYDFTVTAVLGGADATNTYKPVTITASGGGTSSLLYETNITFTGS